MEVLPAFLNPMQWGPLGVGRSVWVAGNTGVHHRPLPLAKIMELWNRGKVWALLQNKQTKN